MRRTSRRSIQISFCK